MTTFARYQKPAYDDAVASATRYVGLYPKSPDTPYMYYLGGMSYYNQITNGCRTIPFWRRLCVLLRPGRKIPRFRICRRRP